MLSPALTQNGNAILANDPHLEFSRPPLLIWIALSMGEEKRIGGGLPGVPVMVSGTNNWVAWGLTNTYLDVADVAYVPVKESDLQLTSENFWIRTAPSVYVRYSRTLERLASPYLRVLPHPDAPPAHKAGFKMVGLLGCI